MTRSSPAGRGGAGPADAAPKTLSDAAYRTIRNDLLGGRYEPDTRLPVEQLKLTYGIGASPLREALSRLTSEGLVTLEGQRGFRTASVSLRELDDITRTRILLETRALADGIENGHDAWEAGIVAAHYQLAKFDRQREGFEEWERRNRAFHRALVAGCDSRWLLQFLSTLYDQHERYRRMALAHPELPRNVADEHKQLMEATLARDAERATAILSEHIGRTAEIIRAVLARDEAPGAGPEARLRPA
jgi:DNA-binding GntR family transcriptional regulator